MELSQLEQMVRWLDEERKKDKATIAALQERLEQQALMMEAQARDIEALRPVLTQVGADIRRTDDYPAMIEKSSRDLTGALEDLKTVLRREKAESERLRRVEIEALSQEIVEIDRKYRPILRHEEILQARAAGEQRIQTQVQQISNSVTDLSKRLEDRLQSLVYLEEQRRADTRRLATLEGELPPVRQEASGLNARIVRLEESTRKIAGRIEEAIQVAKSYDPRIEELRVADFQREQRMKQYAEQAEEVNAEVARLLEQTQKYALLYNQNRQALDSLEAFRTRLDKRQNEIAEMQRLTEERLRREWEEWQAAFARDWQKRLVTEEDRWRRQDLSNQKVVEHLGELDESTAFYYEEILTLWEVVRDANERWGNVLRDTIAESQEKPNRQIKELRRYAEEKRKDLL